MSKKYLSKNLGSPNIDPGIIMLKCKSPHLLSDLLHVYCTSTISNTNGSFDVKFVITIKEKYIICQSQVSVSKCQSQSVRLTLSVSHCSSHSVRLTVSFSQCPSHSVRLTVSISQCPSHSVCLTGSVSQCLSHSVRLTVSISQCPSHSVHLTVCVSQ